MRGLDPKSGFGTSPNTVIPTLSAAKGRNLAPALFSANDPGSAGFLAEFTLSTQSEIPSLRSGQALRFAQSL